MEDVSQTENKGEAQPEAEKVVEKTPEKDEKFPALDRAEDIRDGIKKENDRHEELLNRQEALMAKQTLGGRASAGGELKTPEQEEEEKLNEEISASVKRFD